MSPLLRGLALALVVCGAAVVIDQGSKGLVETQLARGESSELLPFLSVENTRNRGVAFGLGGEASPLFIAVTIAALVALLAMIAVRSEGPDGIWPATGLLVGGAIGNLADRVREGAVIDFIDLPLWPTFNLADVAIVAGVLLLLLRAHDGDETRPDRAVGPG